MKDVKVGDKVICVTSKVIGVVKDIRVDTKMHISGHHKKVQKFVTVDSDWGFEYTAEYDLWRHI